MCATKSTHDGDDSYQDKHVAEIEPPKENGEQITVTNSYLPTLQLKVKTKVEGLITYSLDQQIFKFKVTSGNNQELWGVNVDFKSNQNKWTIDAIFNIWVFILQQRIHVL